MIFRYYRDQLEKMESAKRQKLESCASARTGKWIERAERVRRAIAKAAGDGGSESANGRALPPVAITSNPLPGQFSCLESRGASARKIRKSMNLSDVAHCQRSVSFLRYG